MDTVPSIATLPDLWPEPTAALLLTLVAVILALERLLTGQFINPNLLLAITFQKVLP